MQQHQTTIIRHWNRNTHDTLTIPERYPRVHTQPAAGRTTITWGILLEPRIRLKVHAETTQWEEASTSRIVHAQEAWHGGWSGYKEACFSHYLFTISSLHFVPVCLCLSYSSLPFDCIPPVLSFDKFFKFFVTVFYICYIQINLRQIRIWTLNPLCENLVAKK